MTIPVHSRNLLPDAIFVCALLISSLVSLAAQTLSANPASVTQSFHVNGAAVSANVSISGSGSITLSPATQSGGNWLAITPTKGTPPFTATVTMDPSGLPDGTYLGSITAGTGTIPVTILVGNPGPQLTSKGIVNAASFEGGGISPGEVVALFGTGIGPQIPYSAQIWDGIVQTRLAGTRVWIDNTPAPVLYAYPNQLAVVVPYEIAGKSSVQVQVENLAAQTPPFSVSVSRATPAFFTADGSGTGQIAALNQDNSRNSAANPAAKGSIVVLYATGFGTLTSAVADGTIVSASPFPIPDLPVVITIGGQTAEIAYAGAAPFLVAGVIQINVRVPAGIPAGNAKVVATAGAIGSTGDFTVAVQ